MINSPKINYIHVYKTENKDGTKQIFLKPHAEHDKINVLTLTKPSTFGLFKGLTSEYIRNE